MNSINLLNDKNFTLNGIQYFRNYVSAVHGTKVEVYNCYERKDVLIPLTHFSEFSVNGSTYTSAAALQVALLDVTYSRITGSDSSTIDQNNVGRTINVGLVGPAPSYNPFFSVQTAVSQKLNQMEIVITAKETPVIITASLVVEGPSVNYVSKAYKYLFKPGKGSWGLNGTAVSTSHLEEIMIRNYLVDDLLSEPNAIIENLGTVTNGDFIAKANTSDWNFYDSGTQSGAGEKTYYFSYETNDVLYFAQFTGTPGSYGLSYDAKFTSADFISSTDSRIGNVPNLEQVLEQGGNINLSQFTNNGNGDSPFSTVADTNGLKISINQAAAEMYLKNSDDLVLATINLGFLNNEGTTFFYSESTQKLELKNDDGEVLSEVPVSAFVSNLIHSVEFNPVSPFKLDFKDAEGNNIDSVNVKINNVEGLKTELDGKANKDGSNATGTWPNIIAGDTGKWNGLRRDAGNLPDPINYITFNSDGIAAGSTTKSQVKDSLGINLKANDNEVIKTTGNQVKSGDLALYDTLVHLKPEGGVVWSSKIDEANNFIFTNDYQTTTPSLRINQMGNVDIPNGKLSVLSAPTGNYDVVRLQELNAGLSAKAEEGEVVKLTGFQTINGIKNFTNEIKTGYGVSTPSYLSYEINGGYYIRDTSNSEMLTKFYSYPADKIDFYRKIYGTGAEFSEEVIAGTGKGFQNASYLVNDRNPIWSFKNAPAFGISYYQSNNNDKIGYHFGDITNPIFNVFQNGGANFSGSIKAASGTDFNHVVTLSQLNSGLATSANTVGNNYIPKVGSVTKNGTLTFTDAPIVPQATLNSHAVNKQQMQTSIDLAVSDMMTNIKMLFSPDVRLMNENVIINNSSFNATKSITLISDPYSGNNEPYGEPTVFFADPDPIDGLTVYIKPFDYPQASPSTYVIIDLTATGGINVDGPYGQAIDLWHGTGSQGIKLISMNGKWLMFNY